MHWHCHVIVEDYILDALLIQCSRAYLPLGAYVLHTLTWCMGVSLIWVVGDIALSLAVVTFDEAFDEPDLRVGVLKSVIRLAELVTGLGH